MHNILHTLNHDKLQDWTWGYNPNTLQSAIVRYLYAMIKSVKDKRQFYELMDILYEELPTQLFFELFLAEWLWCDVCGRPRHTATEDVRSSEIDVIAFIDIGWLLR